jgi:hypothetical protein
VPEEEGAIAASKRLDVVVIRGQGSGVRIKTTGHRSGSQALSLHLRPKWIDYRSPDLCVLTDH